MKTNELIQAMQSFGTEEPGTSVVNRILQKLSLPVTVPATPSLTGAASGGMATGMKLLISVGVIATVSSVWYLSSGSNPAVMVNNDINNEKPVVQEERQVVQPVIAEEPPVISGYVSLPDGTALADARVWVEPVLDPYPNFWNQRANDPKNAYEGRICRTDANGYFAFTEDDWPERFVVKAVPTGYPAGITEIIENDALPSSGISIVVDDSGGYIIGTLKNMAGDIITNATLGYSIEKPSNSHRKEVSIPLTIEADGSFTSGLILPGKYNTCFESDGYYGYTRPVFIRKGKAEIVDVTFKKTQYIVITGTVYDAETDIPLSNVEILAKNYDSRTQVFERVWLTDGSGRFVSGNLSKSYQLLLAFQHPKYGFQSKTFSREECSSGPVDVRLSYGAPVRIQVYKHDGTPAIGYKVKRSRTDNTINDTYFFTDNNGEVVFICEPDTPVSFEVFERQGYRTVATGETITPEYGVENETIIYLPPSGTLQVQVPSSVDPDTIDISCSLIQGNGAITKKYEMKHFNIVSNMYMLNQVVTGSYFLAVKGSYLSYLTTNITVNVEDTTIVVYKANTNKNGFITGIVRDSNGIMVPGEIMLWEHNTHEKIDAKWSGDRGMENEDAKPFLFSNLDPGMLYDLSYMFPIATNIQVKGVVPNGPPVEIIVPNIYRITGKIITDNGEKIDISIRVYKSDYTPYTGQEGSYGTGEFFWYPLISGTYYFEFMPNNTFAPIVRKVTIIDSDVDIGDIVFDSGITLSGKIVDENHQAISTRIDIHAALEKPNDWNESVFCSCRNTGSIEDGTFMYSRVPKDHILLITARQGRSDYSIMKEIGPFSSDVDLGTLVMEKGRYLIVSLKDSSGSPVPGLTMYRTISDENGIWKGRLLGWPQLSFGKAGKRFYVPYWPTDAPTNHLSVTVPDELSE